jgi:hypothetical protein
MYDAGVAIGAAASRGRNGSYSVAPVGTDTRELNCAMSDQAIAWDPVA